MQIKNCCILYCDRVSMQLISGGRVTYAVKHAGSYQEEVIKVINDTSNQWKRINAFDISYAQNNRPRQLLTSVWERNLEKFQPLIMTPFFFFFDWFSFYFLISQLIYLFLFHLFIYMFLTGCQGSCMNIKKSLHMIHLFLYSSIQQ